MKSLYHTVILKVNTDIYNKYSSQNGLGIALILPG